MRKIYKTTHKANKKQILEYSIKVYYISWSYCESENQLYCVLYFQHKH